jgi:hypothetical protein
MDSQAQRYDDHKLITFATSTSIHQKEKTLSQQPTAMMHQVEVHGIWETQNASDRANGPLATYLPMTKKN